MRITISALVWVGYFCSWQVVAQAVKDSSSPKSPVMHSAPNGGLTEPDGSSRETPALGDGPLRLDQDSEFTDTRIRVAVEIEGQRLTVPVWKIKKEDGAIVYRAFPIPLVDISELQEKVKEFKGQQQGGTSSSAVVATHTFKVAIWGPGHVKAIAAGLKSAYPQLENPITIEPVMSYSQLVLQFGSESSLLSISGGDRPTDVTSTAKRIPSAYMRNEVEVTVTDTIERLESFAENPSGRILFMAEKSYTTDEYLCTYKYNQSLKQKLERVISQIESYKDELIVYQTGGSGNMGLILPLGSGSVGLGGGVSEQRASTESVTKRMITSNVVNVWTSAMKDAVKVDIVAIQRSNSKNDSNSVVKQLLMKQLTSRLSLSPPDRNTADVRVSNHDPVDFMKNFLNKPGRKIFMKTDSDKLLDVTGGEEINKVEYTDDFEATRSESSGRDKGPYTSGSNGVHDVKKTTDDKTKKPRGFKVHLIDKSEASLAQGYIPSDVSFQYIDLSEVTRTQDAQFRQEMMWLNSGENLRTLPVVFSRRAFSKLKLSAVGHWGEAQKTSEDTPGAQKQEATGSRKLRSIDFRLVATVGENVSPKTVTITKLNLPEFGPNSSKDKDLGKIDHTLVLEEAAQVISGRVANVSVGDGNEHALVDWFNRLGREDFEYRLEFRVGSRHFSLVPDILVDEPIQQTKPTKQRAAGLISVGADVPDATARDQNGEEVVLKKFFSSGVTLVYFYPKSDTPDCTEQACSVRDDWKSLQERGIQVLGVSGDPVSAQKVFKEKHQLPFTIVSDVDGKVAAAFGVPMTDGKAQRSSFLVRNGKVVWTMEKATTQDHSKVVMQAFDALDM